MNLSYIINGTTTGITFPLNKTLITIGVSYYIFQAISYLIDIYLDIEKPELHLGYFALYMSFFPKLLQGPIERAHALIPQLHEKYEFNYNNMRSALLIITGGLFKKIVIADRLALYVNPVYNNVTGYSGIIFIITTYLYALQIYFEFSGYTDIALGTGRLFNIKLTQNFNSPYFANSVADFWRRWHISFSRWILDYIFKPMQMKLREWRSVGTVVAIIITFVISGVWHGASWCFIVWGLLHGLYLGAAVIYQPIKNHIHEKLNLKKTKILKVCQVMVTFHLVSFAWIFFRANNIGDAWYIVNHMLTGAKDVSAILISQKYDGIIVLSTSLIAMYILRLAKYKYDLLEYLFDKPTWIRWSYYYTVIMAILFFGVYDDSKFIYFQF
jgi:D-alanyl-lipoteichoic acid acyltransferase DltB (MBOAT superfamily)